MPRILEKQSVLNGRGTVFTYEDRNIGTYFYRERVEGTKKQRTKAIPNAITHQQTHRIYFDVFSAYFKRKELSKKIHFYVITSPTALDKVKPKISKTTKPLRIRIALAISVSQTPCSVESLTTTDAVFAK